MVLIVSLMTSSLMTKKLPEGSCHSCHPEMEVLLSFLMFRLQRNDGDGRITMASIDRYEHQDEGAPNYFVGFSVNSASAPF